MYFYCKFVNVKNVIFENAKKTISKKTLCLFIIVNTITLLNFKKMIVEKFSIMTNKIVQFMLFVKFNVVLIINVVRKK